MKLHSYETCEQVLIDYPALFPSARLDELARILAEKKAWVGQDKKGFLRYRQPLRAISHLRARTCFFDRDVVTIGQGEELSTADRELLEQTLRAFIPWRKGPFMVFDIFIDAEWQSQRKWNLIIPFLPDLKDRVIGDIGSNNGYYMFRMVPCKPRLVLGFEPYVQHYYAFRMLNQLARQDNLHTELLGIEHLSLFPECFDVLFCLGIIYHRRSPLDALSDVFAALKPGGTLILESQAIPGTEPVALFPEKTYAKVPGTWFVPTGPCLTNWLARCGFTEITMFCQHPMTGTEQRRTKWMRFESYEDFLDPENRERTVEGYPAPWRIFFSAQKP